MKSYNLVPKRSLNLLSEIFTTEFNVWLDEWAPENSKTADISVFNAFDKHEFMSDEYKLFPFENGSFYISCKYSLDVFFEKIILNRESIDSDEVNTINNILLDGFITGSINGYFNNVFTSSYDENISNESTDFIFKKGSGGVVVVLSVDNNKAVFLLSQSTYQKLLPLKTYKRQTESLDNLDVSKINNTIDVSVMLNNTKLNIKDLLGLTKGDYLVLDHKSYDDLNLMNKKTLISKCQIGSNENLKTICITEGR